MSEEILVTSLEMKQQPTKLKSGQVVAEARSAEPAKTHTGFRPQRRNLSRAQRAKARRPHPAAPRGVRAAGTKRKSRHPGS